MVPTSTLGVHLATNKPRTPSIVAALHRVSREPHLLLRTPSGRWLPHCIPLPQIHTVTNGKHWDQPVVGGTGQPKMDQGRPRG